MKNDIFQEILGRGISSCRDKAIGRAARGGRGALRFHMNFLLFDSGSTIDADFFGFIPPFAKQM